MSRPETKRGWGTWLFWLVTAGTLAASLFGIVWQGCGSRGPEPGFSHEPFDVFVFEPTGKPRHVMLMRGDEVVCTDENGHARVPGAWDNKLVIVWDPNDRHEIMAVRLIRGRDGIAKVTVPE